MEKRNPPHASFNFILTGDPGSGKSTYVKRLISRLKAAGVKVGGIAAPCMDRDSRTYDLQNIDSGKSLPLSTAQYVGQWEKAGVFYFNPAAIEMGNQILFNAETCRKDLVVLDEVGPFELSGRIWAGALDHVIGKCTVALLLVVRRSLVEEVVNHWKLQDPAVIDIESDQIDTAYKLILNNIRKNLSV